MPSFPSLPLFLHSALLFDHLGPFFYPSYATPGGGMEATGGVIKVRETRLVLARGDPSAKLAKLARRISERAAAGKHTAGKAAPPAPPERPLKPEELPLLFCPVLPPVPASEAAFEGSRWSNTLASYRLFGILVILLAVNAGAWVITLVTVSLGSAAGNPLNVVWAWQFRALEDITRSVLLGVPTLLALALWAILAAVIAVLFYWLHVTAKAPSARCFRGNIGLSSVLPLTLAPRAPLLMVSYPWAPHQIDVARSLASVLPNCWVDVQMLVPGSDVPAITRDVSRWCFCMVLCLSTDYLTRPACVLEFVTAVLHRRWYQSTVAYVPGGTPLSDAARELVARLGVTVFTDPMQLLTHLDNHVYSCSSPEDNHRCTAWYGRVSSVRCDAPRGLRLPAPLVASTPISLWSCDRLLAPSHAVCAGRNYITADGGRLGRYAAFSIEQVSLCVAFAFIAFSAGCLGGSFWELWFRAGEVMRTATLVGLPATVLGIVFLLVGSTIPLRVDLGFNNFHSPVLLPLNVAAFCNHLQDPNNKRVYDKRVFGLDSPREFLSKVNDTIKTGIQEIIHLSTHRERSHSFSASSPIPDSLLYNIAFLLPPGSGDIVDDAGVEIAGLRGALNNLAHFINLLDVQVTQHTLDDEEARKCTLFLFVLPTKADAAKWRAQWQPSTPAQRSVLVVSQAVFDACDYLRSYMLIVLGEVNGLSKFSSYASEGLAVAVLDALGAKVGSSFLEKERVSWQLGDSERAARIAGSRRAASSASSGSGGGGAAAAAAAAAAAVVEAVVEAAAVTALLTLC
jgi:hypothetical protein